MAMPVVFVSSTFYDLRHLREGVRRFVESLGYLAVLSETGQVYFDPTTTAAEACLLEVPNANLFVLLIGGRYGSEIPEIGLSVTNAEYQAAVKERIAIFALVEADTLSDYQLYQANKNQIDIIGRMTFPHADDVRIFNFIDDVKNQVINNALVPFRTLEDIELYLRGQWAGMMHSYLNRDAEETRVQDSLHLLAQMNKNIEALSGRILNAVGAPVDRVAVQFLDRMLKSQAVTDLRYIGGQPSPGDILTNETFDGAAEATSDKSWIVSNDEHSGVTIAGGGDISEFRYDTSSADYETLRKFMLERLQSEQITVAEYLSYEKETGIGNIQLVPDKRRYTGAERISWKVGDRVSHSRWGPGSVTNAKGEGDGQELIIRFDATKIGAKRFKVALTPIVPLDDEAAEQ